MCVTYQTPLLEVLVISAPEPEDAAHASIEQSPENQAPTTTSPSLGGVEAEDYGNEIITPTGDLLPHDPVEAQPTLDNAVKDVLVEPPQAEGEEPGEANELVEDKAGTAGKMENEKTFQGESNFQNNLLQFSSEVSELGIRL